MDGGQSPACTKDVDECKENKHTCSSNPPVECRNTRGSFTCGNCPTGDVYTFTHYLQILNEPTHTCTAYMTYTIYVIMLLQISHSLTSWSVRVSLGYEGDGFVCTDINECLVNNGGCSLNPRVQCVNNRVSVNFIDIKIFKLTVNCEL